MWIFGKKKEAKKEDKPVDIQQTQKNIDDQIWMSTLNITKYEKLCENLTAQAKEALRAKNKKQATLLMKKKKMYEKEIAKLEGMQMFMEQQKLTMEQNLNNANVF